MCYDEDTGKYEYWLRCGDEFEWCDDTPPDYCMWCGREVVYDAE